MQEEKYNPQKIEKKWQNYWIKNKTNFIDLKDKSKPKFYNLVMFFYPSGVKIHIGHVYNYTGSDVYGRYKRLLGFNVFEPMGYDAFGLPAENYAIKTGVHPAVSTRKNIEYGRKQLETLGLMYDWEKEIDTSSPEYYKWTQWLFGILYKAGLAYQAKAPVNWCPSCKTVLANEQVVSGKCERCDSEVSQKNLKQWFFKITDYAEKLLEGHKKLNWPQKTITMQKNWIGRSEGVSIKFKLKAKNEKLKTATKNSKLRNDILEVFTTRPDTLFGATFMVVAPEHPLVSNYESEIRNQEEVKRYIEDSEKKSNMERSDLSRQKTGVEFKGIKAINPVNNQEIPIWVADYVVGGYGTGAIMAVPAHDQRDFDFAKKYNLPIIEVIKGGDVKKEAYEDIENGVMVNSGQFNGMLAKKCVKKITEWIEKNGYGKTDVQYKLRDWLVSRQRYWGSPIPVIYCEKCGEILVPEKDLPVELPDLDDFKPTDKGESPLARSKEFINVKCPECGSPAKRSAETLDTFVCSSWYFLRFINSQLTDKPFDKDMVKYWLPVDQYCGGAEHACLHLLYARFITMVLRDQEYINFAEPFTKLNHQGMILASNGLKMSKSRGNVVIPDEYIKKYGADVFRMYVLFLAPFSEGGAWNDKGIMGAKRFLDKVYHLVNYKLQIPNHKQIQNSKLQILIHKTIKKVTEDIEGFQFNTAISSLMEFTKRLTAYGLRLTAIEQEIFLILLSPFAPHITEELWEKLGHKTSIFNENWPKYNPEKIKEDKVTVVIQVNGKLRDMIEVTSEAGEEEIKNLAQSGEKIKKWLSGKDIKKIIYITGKLINFVIK